MSLNHRRLRFIDVIVMSARTSVAISRRAPPGYHDVMFWWFKRQEDLLRYEARQLSSGDFEFCVIDEHGHERVERFTNGDALHARQLEFERSLKEDGWTGSHGWNL
jgi:hypothetical protein